MDGSPPTRPSTSGVPKVHPSEGRGLDRRELGTFLFTAERFDRSHAALAVLLGLNGLRVSEACGTNIEDLAFTQGHRTLADHGKGEQAGGDPSGSEGGSNHRPGHRRANRGARSCAGGMATRLDRRTAHRWVRSIGKQAGLAAVYPHMLRSAFIMAALDAGVPLRDVQIAARHADPADDHRLRPPTGELRSPRRLCRGGLRRWRMIGHLARRDGICRLSLPVSSRMWSTTLHGDQRSSGRPPRLNARFALRQLSRR